MQKSEYSLFDSCLNKLMFDVLFDTGLEVTHILELIIIIIIRKMHFKNL